MSDDVSRYDTHHLYATTAGSGAPYSVLTPLRKGLLRALHDALPVPDLAVAFGISTADIERELEPLVAATLAQKRNGLYRPTSLVASAAETLRVVASARDTGHVLAQRLLQQWHEIEVTYEQLAVGRNGEFCHLAFLFVGDMILDNGLLDALARDETLMPPAPGRPSPGHPEARYYFWMIDGTADQLGRYGQRATTLPWQHWYLLTFGQYRIDGVHNAAREGLEAKAAEVLAADLTDGPEALAEHLNILAVNQTDAYRWQQCAKSYANDLLSVYREREKALRQLYASLHASTYALHGFGEFLCWYDHVAYAHAIDVLADAGVLSIPEYRFVAALWYDKREENGFS